MMTDTVTTGPAENPDPTPTSTPTSTPTDAPTGTPHSRIFNAMDHYNVAAESLQQIAANYDQEDFTPTDAMFLLQIAMTHAQLGTLKLEIDRHHRP